VELRNMLDSRQDVRAITEKMTIQILSTELGFKGRKLQNPAGGN
jgi:hypothetical protein